MNVIVSCKMDQMNVPDFGGVTEKAPCTELVSIGLLNFRTIEAAVETLFVA